MFGGLDVSDPRNAESTCGICTRFWSQVSGSPIGLITGRRSAISQSLKILTFASVIPEAKNAECGARAEGSQRQGILLTIDAAKEMAML